MTFYVRRSGTRTDLFTGEVTNRSGWTGPLDTEAQAAREAEAWRDCGWDATVEPDTEDIRAEVAAWEDKVVDGWQHSTDPTQKARWHERESERREAAQ